MRTQVVVVGGGPVGLLLAADLAGYGVDTVLLEERTAVSDQPRATTLHARAVQCLVRRGHLPPSSGGGTRDFHFAGLPGLPLTAPASEPPPLLKRPQAELERHFESRAAAAGVRLLRGHRVVGLVREAAGAAERVRIRAEGPQGELTLHADYAVGADGARGTVRAHAGIGADSERPTVSALAGVATPSDPEALPDGWHRTPRGWLAVKSAQDGERHIRTLDCTGPHPRHRLPVTLEELAGEASRIAGREIALTRGRWLSRFSDYTRLARSFRAGRVLLVGDAAHLHFSIGGQGLSTGVLDALNLGWKLALVVRGEAGDGLLDTYDRERRPAARRVVDNTRAQLGLMRPGHEVDRLRELFRGIVADGHGQRYLAGLISAQDTVHPAASGRGAPPAGTFLPNRALTTGESEDGGRDVVGLLREGAPVLLLFGEKGEAHREAARAWDPLVRVARAPETRDVPAEALLLRPDGYIAWAPGDVELGDALSAWFGPRAGTPRP
ncbi:FAD-dependent monooxygenase [Streptomyces sp. NPDC090029]|uniref:FAD-dependent monooxygenase n=1 Tax=Streptomyces sp. NPDC090029 TaxID=3365924 RepID=UPI00382815D5